MKWLPRTAFSQITATLITLLLSNLLSTFLVVRWLVIDPGAMQFADMISNQLHLFEIELHDFDAIQAKTWLQQHFPHSGYLLRLHTETLPELPPVRFYQIIQQHLTTLTEENISIRFSHEDAQSRLWFQLPWMKGYWLGIPFQEYIQNITTLVGIIFSITTLLSIIAGYCITAYLLQPLKELGRLAQGLPQMDENLPQLQRRGPQEIQQVTQLIEQAALQMRKLIKDRELIMAGVSHDLRTPLARLRIAAEWMPDDGLRGDMVRDVEEMDAIIDDFLDYIRAGQSEPEQEINMHIFLASLISAFQRQGYSVNMQLNTSHIMKLRPIAMTRLLNNLLGNAFKHGTPPVQLLAFTERGHFQIWVKDCGPGIEEQHINALLEPFSQGNKARSKGGSGLGLAIAARIAHTHHAELSVKNRQHGGLKVGIIFS